MGPAPLINRIALVSQWIQFCIATPFQVAIANVFDAADKPYEGFPNFYAHLNDLYAGKAKLLSEGLQEAGLTPVEPQGMPVGRHVRHKPWRSADLCMAGAWWYLQVRSSSWRTQVPSMCPRST